MNRRAFLAATAALAVTPLTRSAVASDDDAPDDAGTATPDSDPPQDFAKRVYAIRRSTDTGLQGGMTIRVSEYADEAAAQRAMDREREHTPERQAAALRDPSFIYGEGFPVPEDIQADEAEIFSYSSISGGAAVEVHHLAGLVRRRALLWKLVATSAEDGDGWEDPGLAFDCARLFTQADPGRDPVSIDPNGFHTGGLWDLLPLPDDHPFIQRIISEEGHDPADGER